MYTHVPLLDSPLGFGFGEMAQVDDKLKDYEIRKEGEAEILLHKRNAVFYNPVQVCSCSIFRVFFSFLFKNRGAALSVPYLR